MGLRFLFKETMPTVVCNQTYGFEAQCDNHYITMTFTVYIHVIRPIKKVMLIICCFFVVVGCRENG